MKSLRHSLATLSAILLLGACGSAISDSASADTLPSVAAGEPAPAMWRLSDEDSEIFLFGTFHLLPPAVKWLTPGFESAMAGTPTTIIEADTTSPTAQAEIAAMVQRFGANPAGVTLSSTLGPERAAQFAAIAARYGLPIQALEPYRPWLAMITLSAVAMQASGFDPNSGVEAVVTAQARKEGDQLEYLETAAFQIEALASLDEAEMLGNFDATVAQFEDFEAVTRRMLAAWRTGDVETLDREILNEMREQAPGAFKILIIDRNAAWADRIDDLMRGEGGYFVAVGAGHLVGEGSVVDMLTSRGYAVERIQ